MTEEKKDKIKKQIMDMLYQVITGDGPDRLEDAERNIYLWDCFINQIKEAVGK